MSNKDLITVIINVYNGEKTIKRCLDSIINQTYNFIEILIINDGSTDNSLKIIELYKDKRIKIINQKNKGLPVSRNIAIKKARGNYIYFVDQDDYIKEDTIEYLYNNSLKYDADISTCKTNIENNKKSKRKEKIKVLSSYDMLKKILIESNRENTLWNKLYKKSLFNSIECSGKIIDDIGTTYKLVLKSKKIVLSNQDKYYYNRISSSMSLNKSFEYKKDLYQESLKRYLFLKEKYPKLIEVNVSLLKTILLNYSDDNNIKKFYKNNKIIELFNKVYSMKIFFTKERFKYKIKFLLFRINPNLYLNIVKFYKNIKRK